MEILKAYRLACFLPRKSKFSFDRVKQVVVYVFYLEVVISFSKAERNFIGPQEISLKNIVNRGVGEFVLKQFLLLMGS